ncbi:MAG: glycosyltransferase [Pseudomonadota bacterium]
MNRLFRALQRVGAAPFTLCCVTDDPAGILPEVRVFPIPDLPVIGNEVMNRGWRKLALFAPELRRHISGPVLYLDLDVILLKSLDGFFLPATPFAVIKDYKRFRWRNFRTGNTSVFLYAADRDYGVYDRLIELGASVKEQFRNEQEFLTDAMWRQGLLNYWPRNWCASYKYQCVPGFPFSLWETPSPPAGAHVLVFHGRPKPEEAVQGVGAKWYRPMKPASWLADYL